VIVPARNAEATLSRCLDSLIAQATDDVELIVVDDNSSDATTAIVSRYPVRLIELPRHAGVSAARNRGAESEIRTGAESLSRSGECTGGS